jgi:DNA (cytosine-5)-methyltransferase 1
MARCRSMIKVLDLFSGIGGFSLGLERAGPFRTVAFCERDAFCQAVLRKHWPDVPIHDDVRALNFGGGVDVITGGYPCQPFSVAGKQKGAADDRHLWPSMFEIIKHKRPRWVVAENVAGHIAMGLDEVLFDLESEGYTARPLVIPACAVDAPHRRDRVWIVAHSDTRQRNKPHPKIRAGRNAPANGCKNVADARSTRSAARLSGQDEGQKGIAEKFDDGSHRPHGWSASDNWATEPDVGRVAHGVPRRVDRLKALGNAVVPQVVEQIGKAILAAEQQ